MAEENEREDGHSRWERRQSSKESNEEISLGRENGFFSW